MKLILSCWKQKQNNLIKSLFVDYKELVRIALISEMQKRGNEILIEVDGSAETFFFAAQRLCIYWFTFSSNTSNNILNNEKNSSNRPNEPYET